MVSRRIYAGFGLAASMLLAQAATAQDAATSATSPALTLAELATRFGARQFIHEIALSPDGRRVAIVENMADGTEILATADLVAGGVPKPVMHSPGGDSHLRGCFWATDTRLVCGMRYAVDEGRGLITATRMFALNADGSDGRKLTIDTNDRSRYSLQFAGRVIDQAGSDRSGTILMTRHFVPESTTGTSLASTAEGLGVERVNVVSLKRTIIDPPRKDGVDFITDGMGTVRLRAEALRDEAGYDQGEVDWFYRTTGSREWQPLGRVKTKAGIEEGFRPDSVDAKLNAVYGYDTKDGMKALYRIKLDGSMAKELVLARPDVDIDSVITIGRQHRVIGTSYATDRRQIEFFDPVLKQLSSSLGKALPGHPDVEFIDSSADETTLLLVASGDTNPGMVYRFDRTARHLEEVLPVRPELANISLATMRPISFTARDGSQVPGYLTLPVGSSGKGLPAIVMPHGGPSARDEWGFDWLAQFFASRGFAVLQPNFRGSAGYGAAWFQKNGFRSWKSAIGDVDDAGKWLVKEGIADPAKLAIVGWSYGGYAALQSGVYEPGLFKAIVAVAPVTNLASLASLQDNFADYYLEQSMIGTGPHVKEGSPAQNARQISVPVLMFHGARDQNVPIGQSREMLAKLKEAGKTVDLVEFPKLDHQLDDAAARASLLIRTDSFLRQSMGM